MYARIVAQTHKQAERALDNISLISTMLFALFNSELFLNKIVFLEDFISKEKILWNHCVYTIHFSLSSLISNLVSLSLSVCVCEARQIVPNSFVYPFLIFRSIQRAPNVVAHRNCRPSSSPFTMHWITVLGPSFWKYLIH